MPPMTVPNLPVLDLSLLIKRGEGGGGICISFLNSKPSNV